MEEEEEEKEEGGGGGREILARLLPGVVRAVSLQEDDGRSRVHGRAEVCPPSLRSPNRPRRPPSGLTNSTTSLSLVNEQPAHPAELAGKPPPEGTKVFVMELLELGGLADVT